MQNTEEEKEHLWSSIRQLKRQRRLSAIREARQLLRNWLQKHPEDFASRDAGEELAMMEEALLIIEAEKAAEPVAA
ncbi:MAG: hypothetical protein ACRYFS_19215 [Janthinobacterium lividum]